MAREESPREDLMREATALVERIELLPRRRFEFLPLPKGEGFQTIVAGFRADGAMSVFFGEDPVYQFNAAGELRRAYCGKLLLKGVRGRLVSLQRVRSASEVQLVRHELTDVEQNDFLAALKNRLHRLAEMLAAGDCEARRRAPPDADVLGHVQAWLATHDSYTIAVCPNV